MAVNIRTLNLFQLPNYIYMAEKYYQLFNTVRVSLYFSVSTPESQRTRQRFMHPASQNITCILFLTCQKNERLGEYSDLPTSVSNSKIFFYRCQYTDLAAGPPMKDRNRKVEPQVVPQDVHIYTNEPKRSTSI